jgi:hypothetical protein
MLQVEGQWLSFLRCAFISAFPSIGEWGARMDHHSSATSSRRTPSRYNPPHNSPSSKSLQPSPQQPILQPPKCLRRRKNPLPISSQKTAPTTQSYSKAAGETGTNSCSRMGSRCTTMTMYRKGRPSCRRTRTMTSARTRRNSRAKRGSRRA